MTRPDGFTRMDFDTHWSSDRKVRTLQRLHPQDWPAYWCAYLALVAEAWSSRTRDVLLSEAWITALPCNDTDALNALQAVRLLDPDGRIPFDTWTRWFEPANARYVSRRERGLRGASQRWTDGPANPTANGPANGPAISPVSGKANPQPTNQPTNQPEQNNQWPAAHAFDLTDPEDVWMYLFGRGVTPRQRDTFLASWLDTEGREGVIALMYDVTAARAGGDKTATDPVGWINARVVERRLTRVAEATADTKRRRDQATQVDEEAERDYRRAVQVWADRGRYPDEFTFTREDPASVRVYLAKHNQEQ